MAFTKRAAYEAVTKNVVSVLEANKVAAGIVNEVKKGIDQVLKPGTFSNKVDLESVVKRDNNGKITHLQCSVSKAFLPATKEFFYEDFHGAGVEGLRRLSKAAESVRKRFLAETQRKRNSINQAVLDGKMDTKAARDLLTELANTKPDYSVVSETYFQDMQAKQAQAKQAAKAKGTKSAKQAQEGVMSSK